MNKPLTRSDLNQAILSKSLVKPAVDALRKITPTACNDDLASHTEIKEFTRWLAAFVSVADKTISQAQADFDNRDTSLINRAFLRLSARKDDLLSAEFQLNNLAKGYQAKVAELKRQGGFSDAEIARFVDDPKPQIEYYQKVVIDLAEEETLIMAFLADAPRYDPALLAGTKVALTV